MGDGEDEEGAMRVVVKKRGGRSLGPDTNKASSCRLCQTDRRKANAEGFIRK